MKFNEFSKPLHVYICSIILTITNTMNGMNRTSKTILITGAASGIGKDSAIVLAKRGHKVIATVHREESVEELKKETGDLFLVIFKLDITLEEDRNMILNYDLDVLINNAGIGESGSLAEIPLNKVRSNFETNVFSTLAISQLALKNMLKNNRGTIIFISSLAGRIPMPFLAPYSMTKFALSAGVTMLRSELKKITKSVHITLVERGGYHTGFNQKNLAKKYEWMDSTSYFYNKTNELKKEETRLFKLTEKKNTKSLVNKIVKAAEAYKPHLRYVAPWWQGLGVRVLRIVGV